MPNLDNIMPGGHVLPKSLSEHLGEKQLAAGEMESLLADETYPIILYLHGNSFDRLFEESGCDLRAGDHRCRLYNVLSDLDFHVIAVDYRGYGDSTGWPSEEGIVADGKLAFNYAIEKAGSNPVYVWGHSMGTGVATKVVMDMCDAGVAPVGLILEAPFNNLKDVVLNHPLSLPFRWIPWFDQIFLHPMQKSGINMSTDERILKVTCPILILHAHDDHIIPCELGQRLTEAAKKGQRDVTFVDFAKERRFGHKHIFRAKELPNIVRKFVDKCRGTEAEDSRTSS